MRLSRLSDRQLRRLIRNADVRFSMDDIKPRMEKIVKLKKEIENRVREIKTLLSENLKEYKQKGLNSSVESHLRALKQIDRALTEMFEFTR